MPKKRQECLVPLSLEDQKVMRVWTVFSAAMRKLRESQPLSSHEKKVHTIVSKKLPEWERRIRRINRRRARKYYELRQKGTRLKDMTPLQLKRHKAKQRAARRAEFAARQG